MDKYDKKADKLCQELQVTPMDLDDEKLIAQALRESAAEAFEIALREACWTDANHDSLSKLETVLRINLHSLRSSPLSESRSAKESGEGK